MALPADPEMVIKKLKAENADLQFRLEQVGKRNLALEERHKMEAGELASLKDGVVISEAAAEIDAVIRHPEDKAQELDIF